MSLIDAGRNLLFNRNRYRIHSEAVIVSCFYNPQGNPYRLLAFQKWYRSIKHLPHRIVECLIGPNAVKQLPDSPYIETLRTDSMLWHKETLLNRIIRSLPPEFRYVFWVDADVLFTNLNWVVDGAKALQDKLIIQPFEYCIHLNKNELAPSFDVTTQRRLDCYSPSKRHPMMWRSFCSNYRPHTGTPNLAAHHNYDLHGHVGFAWGARRELLEAVPLYDKALIGGADHIIAHAATGDIPHDCIKKSFADDLPEVTRWMRTFHAVVRGQVGYAEGDLYHIWHGDLPARDYLRRIQTYTGTAAKITQRDANGLFVADKDQTAHVKKHYSRREVVEVDADFGGLDADFAVDMGYALTDLFTLFGQPTYTDPVVEQPREGPSFDFSDFPNRLVPADPEAVLPWQEGAKGSVPDALPWQEGYKAPSDPLPMAPPPHEPGQLDAFGRDIPPSENFS